MKAELIERINCIYSKYNWREVEPILRHILEVWDLDGYEAGEDGRMNKQKYLVSAISKADESDSSSIDWYCRMVEKLEKRCMDNLTPLDATKAGD